MKQIMDGLTVTVQGNNVNRKGAWKNYTYLDGLAHNWVLAIHRA